MNRSRTAALVTWAYAAMFGVPAVPVAIFLAEKGRLPSLWGLFDMYAGPWSSRFADDRVIALLLVYFGLVLAAVLSGWQLWEMRKAGAVLNLGLLPVEAVFWIGFALPVPWLFGIARVALVSLAWPELSEIGLRRLCRWCGRSRRAGELRAKACALMGSERLRSRWSGSGRRRRARQGAEQAVLGELSVSTGQGAGEHELPVEAEALRLQRRRYRGRRGRRWRRSLRTGSGR